MSENGCITCCKKANLIPQRYITAIMGCLAIVNAYLMRQCLSPTITQLVLPRNYTNEQIKKNAVCEADPDFSKINIRSISCALALLLINPTYTTQSGSATHVRVFYFYYNNKIHPGMGTYDWDQRVQSAVLSAFYFGYIITHLPGGILADKFGSKWVLSLGILSTSFFTLITPWSIKAGNYGGLIAVRVLMGIGEGTTFPALSVLMADWVPPKERGILGALVMGGGQMGSILSNAISGYMLAKYRWELVFYVWGAVAVLWFIFFIFLCFNTPFNHPCITDAEREMLLQEIGDNSSKRRELPPTPYKAIFTSGPMWAMISAQIGHDWAFYILVSYLPKYMNDVLQMNIKKNGLISSLPNVVMWICSLLSGYIADLMIRSGCVGTVGTRKIMTSIAAFGPAIFLIAASYSGCNRVAVTVNFCLCMGLMGAYYGGMKLTPIDMSPNYAGVVMAITNGIGAATGFVAPITVGWMTPNTTLQEWRLVFWVAFAVLWLTALHYCIASKSEIQPWNDPK